MLSIETVNRLSACYRYEAFLYLICNAWELLLKAKLLERPDGKKIVWPHTSRAERHKTISLRTCVDRIFPDTNDPTRNNLERISELRDQCTHLYLSRTPRVLVELFQAVVLNYHTKLTEWFGRTLSDRIPAGMMIIAYDFDPKETDLTSHRLKRELGRETAEFLIRFQRDTEARFKELGQPPEFAVPIEYRVALVKRAKDGDIVIGQGPDGEPTGLLRVAKDAADSHPYLQKHLLNEFKMRKPGSNVTSHQLLCVRRVFKIDLKEEFHWKNALQGSPQYSKAFLDWLISQYEKDSRFFELAVARYKREQTKTQEGFKEMDMAAGIN